jgi:4'-phosphopantetheinyl transferase
MDFISSPGYIYCSFGGKHETVSTLDNSYLNVYYSKTKELGSYFAELKKYISHEEKIRAQKFHYEADRETYVTCHALLRLILAKYINTTPLEIRFETGRNNKPGIHNNLIYFNIAHTRNEFAIAVCNNFHVGIDIESIHQDIDIFSVAKSFFSSKEHDFIFKSDNAEKDRFFLLWTRKEALLKAIGTGLTDNIKELDLSGQENIMNKSLFDDSFSDIASSGHYIYSMRISDFYLSLASPIKASINYIHLDSNNVMQFIN